MSATNIGHQGPSLAADQSDAKELLAEIGRCYFRDIELSGMPNLMNIAALIASSFLRAKNTYTLALGLADYICLSIDGANPTPEEWGAGNKD